MESIVFNGTTFRRYPESDQWAHRMYFTPGQHDIEQGLSSLHREVWKHHNGQEIPPGHEIHHLDFNQLNNDPSNLVCLTRDEHLAAHKGQPASPATLAHLDRIRPMTKEWHASEEGREWHRQHGIEVAANQKPFPHTCEQCGKTYETIGYSRFCSNNCKSAWRRASGIDDVDRPCLVCGNTFRVNRYAKRLVCSTSCRRTWKKSQAKV